MMQFSNHDSTIRTTFVFCLAFQNNTFTFFIQHKTHTSKPKTDLILPENL